MKRLSIGVAVLLILPLLPAAAATTPKAGGACLRVGKTAVASGKKFTCIRSGKKLLWNKGVALAKPQLTPKPTPTPTPAPAPDFSGDTRITPVSALSDVAACRTVDLTPRPDVGLGFPRPVGSLAKTTINILVLPLSFSDIGFRAVDLAPLQQALEKTASTYQTTSYGKLKLNFVIPESGKWPTLSGTAASYDLVEVKPQQDKTRVVTEAISNTDASIDFDLYDGVLIETAYFKSNGGGQGFPGVKFAGKTGTAQRVAFDFGQGAAHADYISHELGHSLFGLEDLYVFLNAARPSVPDPSPAGPWDMMSNSAPTFFGWSKFLTGWLTDVRCVTTQSDTIHYLRSIEDPFGDKAVFINVSSGVTVGAEVRSSSGTQGVLVYTVNTAVAHGDGPIVASKSLLNPGERTTVSGWSIQVLAVDANGALIKVSK